MARDSRWEALPIVFELEGRIDSSSAPWDRSITANGDHRPVLTDQMDIDLCRLADVL